MVREGKEAGKGGSWVLDRAGSTVQQLPVLWDVIPLSHKHGKEAGADWSGLGLQTLTEASKNP